MGTRASDKLPKIRWARLLIPLPESVVNAYGIGCFGLTQVDTDRSSSLALEPTGNQGSGQSAKPNFPLPVF